MIPQAEIDRFAATRKQPDVVVGYDVTFSAPKSVSLLWATSDPPTRAAIDEAWESAVDVGVRYLEAHAAHVSDAPKYPLPAHARLVRSSRRAARA